MRRILNRSAAVLTATALALSGIGAGPASASPDTAPSKAITRTLSLPNGSTVTWYRGGKVTVTDTSGHSRPLMFPRSAGRSGLGATYGPSDTAVAARATAATSKPFTVGSSGEPAAQAPIQGMNTGGVPLPNRGAKKTRRARIATDSTLPTNYGLDSSFQSYLNPNGINDVGVFADARRYLHALPGKGEIVTNVSVGDLTDQSMADAGDRYVQQYGPTTILKGGRRYLDIPAMPLIPTYVADDKGRLDPAGSTEKQDPRLSEVLLDFSVMAPLPHGRQRQGATGSGIGDLLGIAPGADYRLVVPKVPDSAGIAAALRAAAHQHPRPSVITASLGFGTDGSTGYPGRWIEDDPTIRAALASIVRSGIPVVVSANDGTRLALPVSIGPDGGSTPTDVTRDRRAQTNLDDVQATTVPTRVVDDGVIDAGATTTDDVLTDDDIRGGTYPATRYNGGTSFASGFGSRVDLSAPGDNIPALVHSGGSAQSVGVVLSGGTSASAPEIAAAVATVMQAAKATGTHLSPHALRRLLVSTARPVAQPAQADQDLHVGPQLNVTRAFEKVLSRKYAIPARSVRMSVAQRQLIPTVSGTSFREDTDPSAIDLAGPPSGNGSPTGHNAVSPITFGLDMTGDSGRLHYRLTAGHLTVDSPIPSVRVLPEELLAGAGLPRTSTTNDRRVTVTMTALRGHKPVATRSQTLTFLADDGTYLQARAPSAPGHVALGKPVTVHYDLTGVRDVDKPKLILSSVGHYTPSAGVDTFNAAWSTKLTSLKGSVTIPASAFKAGGAGLYGVGIQTETLPDLGTGSPPIKVYGDFRALTVGDSAAERPSPVRLNGGHTVDIARARPNLRVSWDVRGVRHATGAMVEIMAPAPTLYGSINTVTNQNGSKRDDDGFNHPSTLTVPLHRTHGTTTLHLTRLGLPTGLQYPVRVLATSHGRPIGQASATSLLQYRDGDVVDGTVEGFTVAHGRALISTDTLSSDPSTGRAVLTDSATRRYRLRDGRLRDPLTDDTSGTRLGLTVGTDPGTGDTLLLREAWSGTRTSIDVVDAHGGLVKSTPIAALPGLPAGETSLTSGGTVDPRRHVGYAVVYAAAAGLDLLYTIDMATGTVTGPTTINPDNPGRYTSDLTVDETSGAVFATTTGTQGACLSQRIPYFTVKVDPEAGTVSPATSVPQCTAGLAPGDDGKTMYLAVGAATPSYTSAAWPTSTFLSFDEDTMTMSAAQDIGTRGPAWPVYDPVRHVVVQASLYEAGTDDDNNAMSEITVVDAGTGAVVSRVPMVNLAGAMVSNFGYTGRRGLYLDPATHTGWVVNAWGNGLERFRY